MEGLVRGEVEDRGGHDQNKVKTKCICIQHLIIQVLKSCAACPISLNTEQKVMEGKEDSGSDKSMGLVLSFVHFTKT